MDKEQARFILQSFRPDGGDAEDSDFSEALQWALKDRELGEWLAQERAFDASFAQALNTINLPENLREDILASLALQRGDFPQVEDAADATWIGALASIQAPVGLRDKVLSAMDKTVIRDDVVEGKILLFRRMTVALAAVAGIALAFFITRDKKLDDRLATHQQLPIEVVRAGFIQTYESPKFGLELKDPRQVELIQHLKQHGLPQPSCVPVGLENVDGLGCRELIINGKRGSLICFNLGKDGIIHLVIFRREDVGGEFPNMEDPEFSEHNGWSSARWKRDGNVYLLMGQVDKARMATIF